MPAAPLPSLSLATSSAADTGDNLIETGSFSADFSKSVGGGSSGGGSPISGLVRDFATAVAVALASKWIWGKIK